MTKVIFLAIVVFSLSSAGLYGQKGKGRLALKADSVKSDSLEYELIIIDPGFDSWLVTKPSMNYHSKSYYEVKNLLYVSEWNNRYMQPLRYGNIYETYIDYRPVTDYGLEVNYRLYYYFLYFEETNHVTLIAGKK
jgi:hypothetical protein